MSGLAAHRLRYCVSPQSEPVTPALCCVWPEALTLHGLQRAPALRRTHDT